MARKEGRCKDCKEAINLALCTPKIYKKQSHRSFFFLASPSLLLERGVLVYVTALPSTPSIHPDRHSFPKAQPIGTVLWSRQKMDEPLNYPCSALPPCTCFPNRVCVQKRFVYKNMYRIIKNTKCPIESTIETIMDSLANLLSVYLYGTYV